MVFISEVLFSMFLVCHTVFTKMTVLYHLVNIRELMQIWFRLTRVDQVGGR